MSFLPTELIKLIQTYAQSSKASPQVAPANETQLQLQALEHTAKMAGCVA